MIGGHRRQTKPEKCKRERQSKSRCRGKAAPGGLPSRVQDSKDEIQI